jgi:hypothetical protein
VSGASEKDGPPQTPEIKKEELLFLSFLFYLFRNNSLNPPTSYTPSEECEGGAKK